MQTDALDAGKSRESSPASAIVAPLADVSSSEPAEVLPEPTYRTTNGGASKRGALFEQFAALTPAQCQKELRRRKIVVSRAGKPSPGVSTPLRIERNLGDVRWVTPNKKSVYGILDCRLIVALDELSKKLSTWEVKEVHVDNFYRPKSHLPGKKTKLSQHAHGLAVDIHALVLLDGTVLRIEEDFGGEQGGELCGPNAAFSSVTRKSVLLRNLVCNIANEGAFSYFLTPNYDAAHHNHLHGDIKRACRDHVAR